MELKYICKLCNTECKNVISLNSHIQYNHKDYNTQKYYDEFYKKENEGICKTCGKPTKFSNFIKGYRNYCNNSCSHKTEHFITSFRESIKVKSKEELKNWRELSKKSIRAKSSTGLCITDEELEKRKQKSIKHITEILEKSDCTFIDYIMHKKQYKIYKIKYKCNKCNREHIKLRCWLDRKFREQDYNICPICNYSNTMVSKPEKEFSKYICECYKGNILRNDRSLLEGYELDIVIPEKKLAFEFDGSFWHMDSRIYKSTDVHVRLNKTAQEIWDFDNNKIDLCKEKGYKLLRIKELDWNNNKEQIKQLIYKVIAS